MEICCMLTPHCRSLVRKKQKHSFASYTKTFPLGSVSWYQLARDGYTSLTYRYSYLCIFCYSVFTSLSLSLYIYIYMFFCVCKHYIFYIYKIYPLLMHQASLSKYLLDDFIWMSNWCLKGNMFETDLWTFPLNLFYPKSSLSH